MQDLNVGPDFSSRNMLIVKQSLRIPRDPAVPSQKVGLGVGATRVQVPSEKVQLDPQTHKCDAMKTSMTTVPSRTLSLGPASRARRSSLLMLKKIKKPRVRKKHLYKPAFARSKSGQHAGEAMSSNRRAPLL